MSQRQTVLDALTNAGAQGVTNGELNRLGIFRYSARIHELRAAGHQIRTENGDGGLATFFLEAPETRLEGGHAPPPSATCRGESHAVAGGGEQAALFDLPEPLGPKPISAITGREAA